MKVQAVIDRFEEDKAVLLLGAIEASCVWPRICLPHGVGEGDYLEISIIADPDATRAAKQETEDLLRKLLGDNQQ